MTGEVINYGSGSVATPDEIRGHVDRIQRVMKAVMHSGTHYGVIPGTDKPSLFKAGAEVLLTTFRIAVDPEVEDLSDGDHIRFRVTARGVHQGSGIVVGAGIGEASTAEDKYCWRAAVCDEEWEDAPADRRRTKYGKKRVGGGYEVWTTKQVRTNAADLANTVLKMAKKRAQIDLCLTALAASDIFTQDIEDLPEEVRGNVAGNAPPPSSRRTNTRSEPPKSRPGKVTEGQVRLIRTKLGQASIAPEAFCAAFEIGEIEALPFDRMNDALAWIKSGNEPMPPAPEPEAPPAEEPAP